MVNSHSIRQEEQKLKVAAKITKKDGFKRTKRWLQT